MFYYATRPMTLSLASGNFFLCFYLFLFDICSFTCKSARETLPVTNYKHFINICNVYVHTKLLKIMQLVSRRILGAKITIEKTFRLCLFLFNL